MEERNEKGTLENLKFKKKRKFKVLIVGNWENELGTWMIGERSLIKDTMNLR